MVWFSCDACGDTIKKPKLNNHWCSGSGSFTCVDCCVTFDRNSAKGHVTCVTEYEKYALAATKPGGAAANGVNRQQPAAQSAGEPTGTEFLSTRPPWKCSVCNVNCTSQETLLSHAAGVKHKRRARAALAAAAPAATSTEPAQGNGTTAAVTQQQPAAEPGEKEQGQQHCNKSDAKVNDAAMQKLSKVVAKRLKAKGKVGVKKLRKLSCKKLGLEDDAVTDELLATLRDKLVAAGVAKQSGSKLLPA